MDIERRSEARYPGHEADLETAKAQMLEMLEQLSSRFFNQFDSDEINRQINQLKEDYNSIHRAEDFAKGKAHLEELLGKMTSLVSKSKEFDLLLKNLTDTEEALAQRLNNR